MSIIITRNIDSELFNVDLLIDEIAEGTPKYIAVVKYDKITMAFEVDDSWIKADDLALDLLISNHDSTPLPMKFLRVSHSFAGGDSVGVSNASGVYKKVAEFIYPGSDYAGNHDIIRARLSRTGVTDVAIRIRDMKNDKTIVNMTGINIAIEGEYETIKLSPLANLSNKRSSWEVLIKVETSGGGNMAHLSALEIS